MHRGRLLQRQYFLYFSLRQTAVIDLILYYFYCEAWAIPLHWTVKLPAAFQPVFYYQGNIFISDQGSPKFLTVKLSCKHSLRREERLQCEPLWWTQMPAGPRWRLDSVCSVLCYGRDVTDAASTVQVISCYCYCRSTIFSNL